MILGSKWHYFWSKIPVDELKEKIGLIGMWIRGQKNQVEEIFRGYLFKLQRDRNQEGKMRLVVTGTSLVNNHSPRRKNKNTWEKGNKQVIEKIFFLNWRKTWGKSDTIIELQEIKKKMYRLPVTKNKLFWRLIQKKLPLDFSSAKPEVANRGMTSTGFFKKMMCNHGYYKQPICHSTR